MDLLDLGFPINFESFHEFLVTNVPNADGLVSTDTGYTVIEKVTFVQADIDAVNGYYNALTQAGEAAKSAPTMQQVVTQKIMNRIAFGTQLMAGFGAQNILAGYTTTQVVQIAQSLASVQALLQSGSLETARSLILSTTPTALITQATINAFAQQIADYLNAGG